MADQVACDAWVTRVLGVDAGSGAALERSAARGREARQENFRGIAYPKLLLRWREAQSNLDTALAEISNDILSSQDFIEDPRFDEVKEAVALLPTLVPKFGGELEDVIDAGINEGQGPQAGAIAAKAIAAIESYREQIAAAADLAELEKFAQGEMGKAVRLGGELDAALAELRAQLAAA